MIKNPHELHYKMLLHVDNILKSFSATCFSLSTEFSELTNANTCPLVIVFNFTQFYKASGIWLNHLYVTLHCQWCLLQLYTLYYQICQLLWHLYSNSIPLFKISKVIAQKYTKRASNKNRHHLKAPPPSLHPTCSLGTLTFLCHGFMFDFSSIR